MPKNRRRRIKSIKRTRKERGTKAKSIIEELVARPLRVSIAVEGIAVHHQNGQVQIKTMIATKGIRGQAVGMIGRTSRGEGDLDRDPTQDPTVVKAVGAKEDIELINDTRTNLEINVYLLPHDSMMTAKMSNRRARTLAQTWDSTGKD